MSCFRSPRGVVVKLLGLKTMGRWFDPGLLHSLDGSLNTGPISIFEDKLLVRAHYDLYCV